METNPFMFDPMVYIVGDEYQIMFITHECGIGYVEIANQAYKDTLSGTIRSSRNVHKIIVPMEILNQAGAYTVVFRKMSERKAYWPQADEPQTQTYTFHTPAQKDSLNIYFLADTHSAYERPSQTAGWFGDALDILVLCGDIGDTACTLDSLATPYKLSGAITNGTLPVINARGNHDMRGAFAEFYDLYMGTDEGRTYFTFRIGNVWGVVLDCGEDKGDDRAELGPTADYTAFREKQLIFLQKIIREKEYKNAKHKIAICHIPFPLITRDGNTEPVYKDWTAALNEIGVDVLLSGHTHRLRYIPKGYKATIAESTDAPAPRPIQFVCETNFPIILGSCRTDDPTVRGNQDGGFTGTAIKITDEQIKVSFTNSKHECIQSFVL
jgi:predicted phosphodiesterase